jgi:hypothetical protein
MLQVLLADLHTGICEVALKPEYTPLYNSPFGKARLYGKY